jgi:hypothetical protein
MSRIMRQLYAEALAVRAAEERAREAKAAPRKANPFWNQNQSSGIEWWKSVYERAGRVLKDAQAEVARTAINSVQRPSSPEEHVAWWQTTMKR